MSFIKLFKNITIQPKSLGSIFAALLIVVVLSVIVELNQSRSETLDLMVNQSKAILETTIYASVNALRSSDNFESQLQERLLNNANNIKILYEKGILTNELLQKISEENNIYRINVFNNSGKKLFSNKDEEHTGIPQKNNPAEILQPVFEDETDTLIIGIKEARFLEGSRFAVAVATESNGAVVVNLDAGELLKFRRKMGFGYLLREIVNNKSLNFAAFQDTTGILAASGNVKNLEGIYESGFLTNALRDSIYNWCITDFEGEEIFEAVHSLKYNGSVIGLLRIGLSLESLNDARERIFTRSILMGGGLLVLGFVIISLVFVQQNFDLLKKQYRVVESFSDKVLNNVNDAIIVVDKKGIITAANKPFSRLFEINTDPAGKNITEIADEKKCGPELLSKNFQMIDCKINDDTKMLIVTKSSFYDEDGSTKNIIVMRDITEQKRLEEQIKRSERLTAMGELASGVAHEIRNPLNSIGTIAQQLNKDFIPKNNDVEYSELTKIIYREVKRINDTVENFLRFARPEKIIPGTFQLSDILDQIKLQFGGSLASKNINLEIKPDDDYEVNWDKNKILQVCINLIKNSMESIDEDGNIIISITKSGNKIIMVFEDDGPGIPDDKLPRIFDLYFTTKASGSGIGLSIIQKIIEAHGGEISAENNKTGGASFTLIIPADPSMENKI